MQTDVAKLMGIFAYFSWELAKISMCKIVQLISKVCKLFLHIVYKVFFYFQ
jgi:hypothetical protein